MTAIDVDGARLSFGGLRDAVTARLAAGVDDAAGYPTGVGVLGLRTVPTSS